MRPSRLAFSRFSLRELLVGGFLIAVIIAGVWFQSARLVSNPWSVERPEGEPDYVIEHLRTLSMDENGRPAYELRSPRSSHFPQDDHSELEAPSLRIFDPELPPWEIRSEQAWVSPGVERILLRGEVEAERAASVQEPEIRLLTRELLLIPDQDYAETDQRAIMDRGPDRIIAETGFKVWLEPAMRVELFGRVVGGFLSVMTPEDNPR